MGADKPTPDVKPVKLSVSPTRQVAPGPMDAKPVKKVDVKADDVKADDVKKVTTEEWAKVGAKVVAKPPVVHWADLRLHDCAGMDNGIQYVRAGHADWILVLLAAAQDGGWIVISNRGHLRCSKCGETLDASPTRLYFPGRRSELDMRIADELKIDLPQPLSRFRPPMLTPVEGEQDVAEEEKG